MKHLLRISFLYCLLCFAPAIAFGQTGKWTWVHGSSGSNPSLVTAGLGISNSTNTPGGRYGTYAFTDLDKNFWFFGGLDISINPYSDLWKYDVALNEWTWVKGLTSFATPGTYGTKGIPAASNAPGGRAWGGPSWVDLNGNFWMLGGQAYDAVGSYGYLNDLWRYNPTTNEWTWMNGPNTIGQPAVYGTKGMPDPSNVTPARLESAASWVDANGNLWVFGGVHSGLSNSLWMYDVGNNLWTWVTGSSTSNQVGVYGTKGVPNVSNTPGARWIYAKWTDLQGNFWLYGGRGYGASGGVTDLNDLWMFDPITEMWTWMQGPTSGGASASLGTICQPSPSNTPGPGFENRAAWVDQCTGNLWMAAGFATIGTSTRNALWAYDINTGEWTWTHGNGTLNLAPVYGTKGVASTGNNPGGRAGSTTWQGTNSAFWIYGGATTSYNTFIGDLWKYETDSACGGSPIGSLSITPDTTICLGDTIQLSVSGGTTYSWSSVGWMSDTTSANPSVSPTVATLYNVTSPTTCLSKVLVSLMGGIVPLPPQTTSICTGDSTVLLATGGFSYLWSTGDTTDAITVIPTVTTVYSVERTDTCNNLDTAYFTVTAIPADSTSTQIQFCEGDSVFVNGTYEDSAGLYNTIFTGADGCDSILSTQLIQINSTYVTFSIFICSGDSALIFGNYESSPDTFNATFQTMAGCDSNVTMVLGVFMSDTTYSFASMCPDDSVLVFGNYEFAPNVFYDTLSMATGCDSLVITQLDLLPADITNFNYGVCQGDSMLVFGNYEFAPNTLYDTLQGITGCDSVIIVDLNSIKVDGGININTYNVCPGDSQLVFGVWEFAPNVLYDTLPSSVGCDSVIKTLLNLVQVSSGNQYFSLCPGDSMLIFGGYGFAPDTITDTVSTLAGCDSLVITQLDVILVGDYFTSLYLCPGDSVFVGGDYQNAAGIFQDTVLTSQNCDSLIVTTVIISDGLLEVNSDTTILDNECVSLSASGTGTFSWSPAAGLSCITCQNPVACPTDPITYYVTITDSNGCELYDSIQIDVISTVPFLEIPDAFTPNASGISVNDRFYIFDKSGYNGAGIETLNFQIYNRWGEMIFEATEPGQIIYPNGGWDGTNMRNGKPMEVGVYVWVLKGATRSGGSLGKLGGNLTLLR